MMMLRFGTCPCFYYQPSQKSLKVSDNCLQERMAVVAHHHPWDVTHFQSSSLKYLHEMIGGKKTTHKKGDQGLDHLWSNITHVPSSQALRSCTGEEIPRAEAEPEPASSCKESTEITHWQCMGEWSQVPGGPGTSKRYGQDAQHGRIPTHLAARPVQKAGWQGNAQAHKFLCFPLPPKKETTTKIICMMLENSVYHKTQRELSKLSQIRCSTIKSTLPACQPHAARGGGAALAGTLQGALKSQFDLLPPAHRKLQRNSSQLILNHLVPPRWTTVPFIFFPLFQYFPAPFRLNLRVQKSLF